MNDSLRSAPVVAWLVLAVATVASLLLGTDHGLDDRDAVAATLLALAFAKVYLVGRHFMELHAAAPVLRRAFDAYVAIIGATLVVLVLAL
jgi:hypothetical protein